MAPISEWSLPTEPGELLELAAMAVAVVIGVWASVSHLLSGFLPPRRMKRLPKAGKLTKIVSPHLQAFAAALPRASGDVLASTCQPIGAEGAPWYDSRGRVEAMLPLWKSDAGCSVAVRRSSRRHKERTEFMRLGEKPDEYEIRAFTEQGFLADTMIDVMGTLDWGNEMSASERARRASEALGFAYGDETVRWYREWRATDWTKPLKEEEDDEDMTPDERAALRRDDYVTSIDKREA